MEKQHFNPKYAEVKYIEIGELYEYCLKIGVEVRIEPCWDGYAIRFNNGGDFVQHDFSYGGDVGFVEPQIGCRKDYSPVSLENAKALVKRHKDRLNKKG